MENQSEIFNFLKEKFSNNKRLKIDLINCISFLNKKYKKHSLDSKRNMALIFLNRAITN